MRGTLVNLNVNPCKMCMPMGAVTALYGIKKCMSILHGSQGCSTYIRRHMATHYNEPIDIASSSLTEEGTVYGGEKNLIQGLKNLITIYEPQVIGVATTCLAETIGEDINRIIDNFYKEYPEYKHITVIPISSAGYAGTQFEGYMGALYQIVKNVPMDLTPNNKINIITSQLSPADTRYLKDLLENFNIDYILLPDISENLDGVYQPKYEKLPRYGTDINDVKRMAGARFTIELSSFTPQNKSIAEYLNVTYGIPFQKCNLPVGLRDNDALISLLTVLSDKPKPEKLIKERGRFLDAMIDAHKYNGEARAAIFGEPDFVYSTVRMCVENGIMPIIAATGTSKCTRWKELLKEEISEIADSYFIERYEILEDVDFQTIEELSRELGVNVLIGNSDGRRVAEKLDIELVRRSFPIHDRMGGQRLRTMGYEGSLTYLDEISNAILGRKESSFREHLYKEYYKKADLPDDEDNMGKEDEKAMSDKILTENIDKTVKDKAMADKTMTDKTMIDKTMKKKSMEEKTLTHPCYNCGAHDYARMHLPIAPKCNISCNYCVRKFDCPNESRPGVTTAILKPEEALQKFLQVKEKVPKLSVIGIAGPGDALANFEETRKTLALIKEQDPDITFCLSTNGLMLPQYANELIELGVSHVTVTMNAVDPKIGALVYKYVDYMGIKYYGEAAAAILLSNQLAGIRMLTSKGTICKVNIVMLKGINEMHIPEVVRKVKELGGTITNIMQLIPVEGSVFEGLPLVSNLELMEMRKKCGETMKQMFHCKQCRADAIGTLGNDLSIEFNACHASKGKNTIITSDEKIASEASDINTNDNSQTIAASNFFIAVASKSGMIVDQHFGHVSEFYVYEYVNGNAVFKERRPIIQYCKGSEECDTNENRIEQIIQTIADCNAVIAMRIGEAPKQKLSKAGIKVFTTYDRIEDSIKKIASEMTESNIEQ